MNPFRGVPYRDDLPAAIGPDQELGCRQDFVGSIRRLGVLEVTQVQQILQRLAVFKYDDVALVRNPERWNLHDLILAAAGEGGGHKEGGSNPEYESFHDNS